MPQEVPSDAPPSYDQATGSSSSSANPQRSSGKNRTTSTGTSHLQVRGKARNGIPVEHRRSMEDLHRPLPSGWVRTFDPSTEHQFFVDTTKDPPRSIWVHPCDDEEYLSSLSGEEREKLEQESINRQEKSKADIMAKHTDEEETPTTHAAAVSGSSHHPELPPRPTGGKGKESLGRRLKDKVTGTTHEEREAERRRREELERQAYQQHMQLRNAMVTAMRTGKPQLVGKDRDGRDVYVEPPAYQPAPGYYSGGGYGYSPYGGYPGGPGVYTTPNARYIRPSGPYGRPYGGGFGGGYGLPLAIGGGLLGGALLGGALAAF